MTDKEDLTNVFDVKLIEDAKNIHKTYKIREKDEICSLEMKKQEMYVKYVDLLKKTKKKINEQIN